MSARARVGPPGAPGNLTVPAWKPLSLDAVAEIIDFGADPRIEDRSVPTYQLEGAVAVHNLLARNRVAYLGDEVGMGKTFVALGVMGLLRLLEPRSTIVVLAPRENLQRKWINELRRFTARHWRHVDFRFRSLADGPVREPVACGSLPDFVGSVQARPDADFYLRMTSFSLWTNERKHQRREREALQSVLPWVDESVVPLGDPGDFRAAYARALNAVVPVIDLLVVDEGHNLKHGFDPSGSTRNTLLAGMFGHRGLVAPDAAPWYAPRVRRLLLLSATPFEHDYTDLYRQVHLLGLGDVQLHDARGGDPRPLRILAEESADIDERRLVAERLLVRRVSGITVAGKFHTRNMYRREWRRGGYATHDEPLAAPSVRERLAVALIQKKVAETLGDPKFGRHFQIGMLTSFESFLESTIGRRSGDDEAEAEQPASFYGDQTDDAREKEGIDSRSIGRVVQSHRKKFGEELPHPKVNATVRALETAFDTGEKALVFVRRIASKDELKSGLEARFNARLTKRLLDDFAAEPGLAERPEVGATLRSIIHRYEAARRSSIERQGPGGEARASNGSGALAGAVADGGELAEAEDDDDEGNLDTFFAWFFRGDGKHLPPDVAEKVTGSSFRKNRLGKPSSPYSLLFEDDAVAWALGAASSPSRRRPADVRCALLTAVAAADGVDELVAGTRLRSRAWAWFSEMARRSGDRGFPPLRVFEAWQAAALEALSRIPGATGRVARSVGERFGQRFAGVPDNSLAGVVPSEFPPIESGIGVRTVPTTIAERPGVADALLPEEWPAIDEPDSADSLGAVRLAFGRREVRRTLFSGQCRLGAPYVDLYVQAIATMGSMESGAQSDSDRPVGDLARRFVARLESLANRPGFHAYAELSATARAFDAVIQRNFEDVRGLGHEQLARTIQQTLTAQDPVASSGGSRLTRAVRQFRMPGFPLILVTTDVLREGEDLHTFCRRVVHYGITWTPSGMEQRVGRVDRIGGLVQRTFAGVDRPDEMLQVHYPYLAETVEVLQIRRVLHRMNEFLRLMHRNLPRPKTDGRAIDAAREFLESPTNVAQILDLLVSAFDLESRREWLDGGRIDPAVVAPDIDAIRARFDGLWRAAIERSPQFRDLHALPYVHTAMLTGIGASGRTQCVRLALRGIPDGTGLQLRVESPVGCVGAEHEEHLVASLASSSTSGELRLEFRPRSNRRERDCLLVGDMPFDSPAADDARVAEQLRRVAMLADELQARLFEEDLDAASGGEDLSGSSRRSPQRRRPK